MTMRTIDCMDCGASVPYGRLSCPACGGLVAAVAGALARPPEPPEPTGPPESVAAAWPDARHRADEPDPPRRAAAPASVYRPPALVLAATPVSAPSSSVTADMGAPADKGESRLDVMDPGRMVELAGWFVIVGATMSLLGLLLPWSRVVIGAKGVGGYLDTWGLASPTHILVFAVLLAVLAFGIVKTPVPAWLRVGVFGLALGSLLIGLVWPYVVGPLGADVGVLVGGLGAAALVIGGVVALWATRHATGEQFV